MKETKHTPEPWHQGIYDNPKRLALAIFDERHDEVAVADTVETARRIVACVNACRSVSDEDLADDCVEKMRADRNQLLEKSKRFCLQCGAPLMLHAVPLNPNNAGSQWTSACSSCGSKAFDVPGNKIKELTAQRDELLAALRQITMQGVSDQHRSVEDRFSQHVDIARKALEKYHA